MLSDGKRMRCVASLILLLLVGCGVRESSQQVVVTPTQTLSAAEIEDISQSTEGFASLEMAVIRAAESARSFQYGAGFQRSNNSIVLTIWSNNTGVSDRDISAIVAAVHDANVGVPVEIEISNSPGPQPGG